MPLQRYKEIIKETEKYFNKWQNLSPSPAVCIGEPGSENHLEEKQTLNKVIAEIAYPVRSEASNGVKSGAGFIIRYTYSGFNRIYLIDRFFEEDAGHRPILYKARHINLRNEITHRIIMGIIEGQKRFLITCDPHDLAVFYESQLCIDKSWVSRLVNRISVIIPNGEERLLRSFFQNNKDINKRLIKKIFDKECEDIEAGGLKRPLGDEHVRACLESRYGVKVSRRSIAIYRKEMGISPASKRGLGYGYPLMLVNFSLPYPLTIESIQNNAVDGSGVYEIQLNEKEIDYPNSKAKVIYIGSAKNIKKRIKEHLRQKNKNSRIREYIKTKHCLFRYIQIKDRWKEEERRLYELFKKTYGAPPRCNKVSP